MQLSDGLINCILDLCKQFEIMTALNGNQTFMLNFLWKLNKMNYTGQLGLFYYDPDLHNAPSHRFYLWPIY